ncbi:uncharacterized protein ACNLHF_003375 isoform 1-T2 [Anomaloglossus baeobatrachus]
MNLILLLLFSKVIANPMVLYQPVDVIYVDVEATAEISCVTSELLEAGTKISWYRKSWRPGGNISLVKSCAVNKDQKKYVCSNSRYMAKLEIRNTQTNDSGDYFCTYYSENNVIGNGTSLVIREDRTMSKMSVHLFNLLQHHLLHNHLMLACVAHGIGHAVRITWNISGKFLKGKMTSFQSPGGNWTFMNLISLPKDTLSSIGPMICKVWFDSTTVVVQYSGKHQDNIASHCKNYLIPVLTLGLLLLLTLSGHLLWIYKR